MVYNLGEYSGRTFTAIKCPNPGRSWANHRQLAQPRSLILVNAGGTAGVSWQTMRYHVADQGFIGQSVVYAKSLRLQ